MDGFLLTLDPYLHRSRLCAAVIDRLAFGLIIKIGTDSRLTHAKAQRRPPPRRPRGTGQDRGVERFAEACRRARVVVVVQA
ncbi:hypothetical protein GCM10023195_76750 [Actinoallomurus liliacearum]|uniref:Uncharacterized protein n=1 Tax=Actinoallomurus liliacearum TaxID=1080073 RepID=A0ABP8TV51_9ACTN